VIIFQRLTRDHVQGIARIQLDHLSRRLAERKLKLEVSEAALEKLASEGYDPTYGARPLSG